MMVSPEIRAWVVEEIDNGAGPLQSAGEPIVADGVIDRAELIYAPTLLCLQKLPGERCGNKPIKARIMEIKGCAFRHNELN